MAKVQAGIQIDRPVEDVFAYATDVDKLTRWLGVVTEARQLTDGPMGEGTQIRAIGKMAGRRMESMIEVTSFEPATVFAFKGRSGPITNHSTFTFERVDGGTRVTDTVELEVSGILGLAEPLLARMLRRQFEANLAALKVRLESQDADEA